MTDIYQDVTDRIIAALESGSIPWHKPWNSKGGDFPHNAYTGRQYSGVNVLLLLCQQASKGYASNGWLTYKQAQLADGTVKKGEKGTHVVFWQFKRVDEEGEKVIPLCRSYVVFNTEQCEGLTLRDYGSQALPATEIDSYLLAAGAVLKHGGNRACYSPSQDVITMPERGAFQNLNDYHATLLHEATHWTGHKSRLDRDLTGRFGTNAYAAEELIAEMGAAFLCARFGVPVQELQHAGYLQSWLSVLRADKRAIFTASSAAQKAADYILPRMAEEQAEAA